jgi:hypothetical protein
MSSTLAATLTTAVLVLGAGLQGCGGQTDSDHGIADGDRSAPGESAETGSAGAGTGGAPAVEEAMTECEPTENMISSATRLYFGPCRTEQDEGFDGVIDSIWEHTYDEGGRLVSTESVATESNVVYFTTTTYDEGGQTVGQETGQEGEEPSWENQYIYEDGRLIQSITGPVGEGQLPLVTDYIYEGDLLVRLEESRREDGAIESRVLFEYNEDELKLRDTYQNAVGDGWVTYRVVEHEYDAEGNEVETRRDIQGEDGSPPDGDPDWVNRNWYSEYGNILVSAEDSDADGTVDTCTVRYYDCWQ